MITTALYAMKLMNMRHNAVAGAIASSEAKYSMIKPIEFSGASNPFQRAKALEMDSFRNSLNYKVATAEEESIRKALDANIKRTFSIFG